MINEGKVNVLEYFYSIDGETRRSGELVWFIRLAGCNLACSYCDTNYCHYDKGTSIEPTTLVKIIMETNSCRKVTLTGGEPLTHPNVKDLIYELLINGFDVNIETNGSVNPYKVLDKDTFGKYRRFGQLWFSMDYKSKFSNMQEFMLSARSMAYILGSNDCLKFVVANDQDLCDAYHRIKLCERYYRERKVPEFKRCTYYLSPCFGEIELSKIIDFMKDKELIKRVKFQVQVHKIVWDPNKRGV